MSLNDDVAAYSTATSQFLHSATIVDDENLDRHVEGGWSARQVIHHVADSEAQSYARLCRLLAEPSGSVIQGYDEATWAECHALGYQDLPVARSLEVFKAVRLASLDVLGRLRESDLECYGEHTESGRYTLATWLEVYSQHPRTHAEQLLEAVNN